MSLTSALNIAASGLGVANLQTEVASRNIANADQPGFTRKSVAPVTTRSGEVQVGSVERSVDAMLVRLERAGRSRLAAASTRAEGIAAYTAHLGQPQDGFSPADMVGRLQAALVTLAGLPSQAAAQLQVVSTARDVAGSLTGLVKSLGTVTREVDLNLRYDVAAANDAMQELAALNRRIAVPVDPLTRAGMADRMSGLVDGLAEFMDIQTVTTPDGGISVYTASGVELVVRGQVFDVGYDAATGRLSAGSVDLGPAGTGRGISGGSLAGLLDLRNVTLPAFGDQLDALAAGLVRAFETANPMPDGRGLFTDAGQPFSSLRQEGLAGRLAVNTAFDPDAGGFTDLLRTGGLPDVAVADASRIDAMLTAFSSQVETPTAGLGEGLTLAELAPALVGRQQAERASAESTVETTRAASDTVASARMNFEGVNIDDEMQKLLLVQRSYAANAKVLTTVSTMLDALLAAV